ncbi:unnamed protein product [Closterium sp. Naga37s-1]|nr:unnamed protein product [Closterium sp. Naga37s-1]
MAYPLIALLVASLAVQASSAQQAQDGCITNFDPTVNYFPDQYQDEPFALPISQTIVETANDFTVQYGNYYKVVKDSYDNTTYVLYQCGSVKPSNFPAATTRFFEIPLKGFAVDSTVAVSFVQYVADAGGVSPAKAYFRIYNMSLPSDKKAFQTLLATLDIVIDETYLMTGPSGYSIDVFAKNAGISVTDTATYKFLATPNVWSMYGRATGAPNYATAPLVLPLQLETGAVVSAANCTTLDPTEVVNPIIPACSATITPEVPGTASAPATPPSSSPPSSPPPCSPPPSSPPPAPKAAASSGSLLGAGLAALLAATIAALV